MNHDDPAVLLKQHFGFDAFRPGQRRVVEHLLAGHSAAAVFPTGGGKSLCYQLPALALPGVTLVVSPLIALMKDQIDALQARGIAAARLDSSLDAAAYREVMGRVRAGDLRLLYVAPERFNNERFRAALAGVPIALFAVDEAHCISEWGHNFRPDYLKLTGFARQLGAERVLALTATATPRVLDDMCRAFDIAPEHAVRTGFYRPNLQLLATPVSARERDAHLLAFLQEQPPGPGIVYVTLQKTAEQVAARLAAAGLPARAYHAGMDAQARAAVQEAFMASDREVVVATIAFGMGVDKANIRYVYHYNLPKSLENYSQEIGRAGRDGEPAQCRMLVCPDDLNVLENFVYGDTPSMAAVQSLVQDLFSRGDSLELNLHELSASHDIRLLVLRTLLTYLELDGYLQADTPVYAEFRFKPLMSSAAILGRFDARRRAFLADLFRQAKKARTWLHIDTSAAASTLGVERERVVRALDWLAEQDMLELQSTGLRHRYRQLRRPDDLQALAADLNRRMQAREQAEIGRLGQVMELAALDSCRTAFLAAHFGETLDQPCGHCSWCLGERAELPPRTAPQIDPAVWRQARDLAARKPDLLGEPRALALLLCGIASPRLSRAKLGGHPLFGVMAEVPFGQVLAEAEDKKAPIDSP